MKALIGEQVVDGLEPEDGVSNPAAMLVTTTGIEVGQMGGQPKACAVLDQHTAKRRKHGGVQHRRYGGGRTQSDHQHLLDKVQARAGQAFGHGLLRESLVLGQTQ